MNKKKLYLKAGEAVQVFGKARICVIRGEISIFGKLFEQDSVINVPMYRGYPIEAHSNASIEVEYVSKAPEKKEGIGTKMWEEVVDKFIVNPSNVLIIGGVDTGKTGLTKFVANRLIHNSYDINVIDLDPGQGDIGLPGFVGGSHLKEPIVDLNEVPAPIFRFIGSISPVNRESIIEAAAQSLYTVLPKTDYTLYNLHGWIAGYKAIIHIYNLIKLTKINSIFYLSNEKSDKYIRYLFNYLQLENSKINLYVVPKANVVKRTRYDRKKIREIKYQEYLKKNDFVNKTIELSSLISSSNCLLPGGIPTKLLKFFVNIYGLKRSPDALLTYNMYIKFLYQSNNINRPILWYRRGKNSLPAIIILLPNKGHGVLSSLLTGDRHLPVFLYGFNLRKGVVKVSMPTEYIYYKIENISPGRVVVNLNTGEEIGVLPGDLF